MSEPSKPKSELVVLGSPIATHDSDLYRLNDLHKIAVERGFATKHDSPYAFLRQKGTKRLIESLEKQLVNSPTEPVVTINGGARRGTYAHRYALLAYAASLHGDVYLDAMQALDAAYSRNANDQLSASQSALRAEKAYTDEVLSVSAAASKLARSKRTVPPLRNTAVTAIAGLQLCFPGLDVTPRIAAMQPKPKRTR
jgi:KilA-N domain